MKKPRKLTAREQARLTAFDALSKKLISEGYEQKNLTISILSANVLGILSTLPFILVLFVAFVVKNPEASLLFPFTLLLLAAYFALIVLHELIHGAMWGLFAKSRFKAISFGVMWNSLTPYCSCSEPLKRWQYVLGAAMPTLILGFALGAVSVYVANYSLCFLSMLLILGGGGDYLIILKMAFFKADKAEVLYIDHPTECGLAVFVRQKA